MEKKFLILENKNYKEFNPLFFGESILNSGKVYKPIIKSTFFFHYIIDGTGTFFCDQIPYYVSAGDLFITFPNQSVIHKSDNNSKLHMIWVEFVGDMCERLRELNNHIADFSQSTFSDLKNVFDLNGQKEEFITGKLFEVYAYLFQNKKVVTNYVSKIKTYIDINYVDENLSIHQIADMIGLNKRYMTKVFKEDTGMTIMEYLIEKRLQQAAGLLRNDELQINEIASKVGYSDAYHFSKMFKLHYNMSPTDYRKKIKY